MTLSSLKFGFETTVKSDTNKFECCLLRPKNIQEKATVEDMNIAINRPTLNNSEASHIVAFLQIWTIPVLPPGICLIKHHVSEQASS